MHNTTLLLLTRWDLTVSGLVGLFLLAFALAFAEVGVFLFAGEGLDGLSTCLSEASVVKILPTPSIFNKSGLDLLERPFGGCGKRDMTSWVSCAMVNLEDTTGRADKSSRVASGDVDQIEYMPKTSKNQDFDLLEVPLV